MGGVRVPELEAELVEVARLGARLGVPHHPAQTQAEQTQPPGPGRTPISVKQWPRRRGWRRSVPAGAGGPGRGLRGQEEGERGDLRQHLGPQAPAPPIHGDQAVATLRHFCTFIVCNKQNYTRVL